MPSEEEARFIEIGRTDNYWNNPYRQANPQPPYYDFGGPKRRRRRSVASFDWNNYTELSDADYECYFKTGEFPKK